MYLGVNPRSMSTPNWLRGSSRTCPIEAFTAKPLPRNLPMVLALAGDSTMTSFFATLPPPTGARPAPVASPSDSEHDTREDAPSTLSFATIVTQPGFQRQEGRRRGDNRQRPPPIATAFPSISRRVRAAWVSPMPVPHCSASSSTVAGPSTRAANTASSGAHPSRGSCSGLSPAAASPSARAGASPGGGGGGRSPGGPEGHPPDLQSREN